jgi:MFS family permease
MLAVELLRDRVITIGSIGGGLAAAVMMGVSAFLPTYAQGARGRSAMTAGLVLGAMSVTWALSSILGGRLMVRTSHRLAALLGVLSLIAGSVMLLGLTPLHGVIWATVASLPSARHGAAQHGVHRLDPGGGIVEQAGPRRPPASSSASSARRWERPRSGPC